MRLIDYIQSRTQNNAPDFIPGFKSGTTVKSAYPTGGGGFNNPFSFYLDAAAPAGGDGTQATPFNNAYNAINAIQDMVQNEYTLFVAPGVYPNDLSKPNGGDIDISGIGQLNIIGVSSNDDTSLGMNIILTCGAHNYFNTFRNIGFNLVRIDQTLASFCVISFVGCNVVLNQDGTPSNGQIILEKCGWFGGNVNGLVNAYNCLLVQNLAIQGTGVVNFEDCSLLAVASPVISLAAGATLKTVGVTNPANHYVNGTDASSNWFTDAASNETNNGTLTKTIYGGIPAIVLLGKKIGFNMNPSLPIFYEVLVGGTFQPGDQITDQTTGNTAIVVSDDGGLGNMVIRNITGPLGKGNTFDNGGGVSAQFDDDYNIVTEEIPLISGNKVISDLQLFNGNTIISTADHFLVSLDQIPAGRFVCVSNAGTFLPVVFNTANRFASMGNLKLKPGQGSGTINSNVITGNSLWAYLDEAEGQPATCDIYVYGYIYP